MIQTSGNERGLMVWAFICAPRRPRKPIFKARNPPLLSFPKSSFHCKFTNERQNVNKTGRIARPGKVELGFQNFGGKLTVRS